MLAEIASAQIGSKYGQPSANLRLTFDGYSECGELARRTLS